MKRLMLPLALALLSAPVLAVQHKDPASACAVAAPAYLASSDYSFKYQGGCKDGLAEGKGKAIWTLVNLPEKQVTWEGTFSAGVYLPPPAGIVSARAWSGRNAGDTVIFDLGALPAQSGIPAARLKVQAASDLANYPDPCTPRAAWVTNAPAAAIVSDSAAQSLLKAAADKLKARCGARLGGQKNNQGGAIERTHLQVRVVSTPDLESDRFGNPGPALVEASMPLAAGDSIERYNNQAAMQQRQQQQQTQDQTQRQANAQRLRAFFDAHQAQGWASLDDIAQNPFRYADRVVVTTAELARVLSPTRATAYAPTDDWGFGRAVLLEGKELAQWAPGQRILAVRVLGRNEDKEDMYEGWARLQLLGSEICKESRCEDWLRLPAVLKDGQKP